MINKKLLLSAAVLSLLYSGCTEDEPKQSVEPTKTVEVNKVDSAVEKTKETAENIKTTAEPVVKDGVDAVEKIEEKGTQTVTPVVEPVKEIDAVPDATKLYTKCTACHGLNAEKSALNSSKIIKDWEAFKIAEALKGYQNGTYGGAMKGLMVGQVANLSAQEIDALSEHIANFN